MIRRVLKENVVIAPGEDRYLESGNFGTIGIMEGGRLELGEDVTFDKVVLNYGSSKEIAVKAD